MPPKGSGRDPFREPKTFWLRTRVSKRPQPNRLEPQGARGGATREAARVGGAEGHRAGDGHDAALLWRGVGGGDQLVRGQRRPSGCAPPSRMRCCRCCCYMYCWWWWSVCCSALRLPAALLFCSLPRSAAEIYMYCRRRRAAGDPRDRPPQRPRRNGAPNPSTLTRHSQNAVSKRPKSAAGEQSSLQLRNRVAVGA